MVPDGPAHPRIAIVLPPRERMLQQKSGAIALSVGDFVRHSRFRDAITIFGGGASDATDLAFEVLSSSRIGTWRLRRTYAYAEHFLARIAGQGFSHIEVHSRPLMFGFLARRLPAELALSLHLHNDPQEMKGLRTAAERARLARRARAVYCVSDFIRERFVAGLDAGGERVHVVHNGIPIAAAEAAFPAKSPVILYVGRIIPEKGPLELARALRLIHDELAGWRVTLIGQSRTGKPTRYEAEVNAQLAVFGARYTRVPFAPHQQVMRHFAEAEITVVPSLWDEPFGRTALEAMVSGSAVVTSGSGGLKELVGEAGIVVDPRRTAALGDAILALARDEPARRARQHSGWRRARELFDAEIQARRLDDLRARIDPRLRQIPPAAGAESIRV